MSKVLHIIAIISLLFPYSRITAQDHQINKKDLNNPDYLYNLGMNYLYGNSVPKNNQDAFSYLLRAARLGHAEAQYRLGYSYSKKVFTEWDSNMGIYWYRKAAQQKHLTASLEIANYYDRGIAHPESLDEILSLYSNILESVPDSNIMYMYGRLYHYGRYGATVNLDSARYWYNKALEYGNEQAQFGINALEGKDAYVKSFNFEELNEEYPIKFSKPKKYKAIIIGNSDYSNSYLPNPVNDATALWMKFNKIGIASKILLNLSQQEMYDSIASFAKEAAMYDAAILYYAGHAVQDHGVNYLIPTDMVLKKDYAETLASCVNVDSIYNCFRLFNIKSTIIILDACRDNRALLNRSRGTGEQGLAPIPQNTTGSFVAYATQSGEVADDGEEGNNSPFMKALLSVLDQPNQQIYDVFDQVKAIVTKESKGRQIPVYMNNLRQNIIFNNPELYER